MTLIKFNRGTRNGSNNSPANQANRPLINTEFGSVLPRLFDTFPFPGFRNEFQDIFEDTGAIGTTLPAVNISETDNELVIEMAAPGMNKKDFTIQVTDNQLHIGYKKESEDQHSENNYMRKEFRFESFERNFNLPSIIESEKIAANYNDGILKISIPKKEEARRKPSKTIEIG